MATASLLVKYVIDGIDRLTDRISTVGAWLVVPLFLIMSLRSLRALHVEPADFLVMGAGLHDYGRTLRSRHCLRHQNPSAHPCRFCVRAITTTPAGANRLHDLCGIYPAGFCMDDMAIGLVAIEAYKVGEITGESAWNPRGVANPFARRFWVRAVLPAMSSRSGQEFTNRPGPCARNAMNVELAFWMFPALLTLIFTGVPVAFSLMVVALVFGLIQFGAVAVVIFAHRVEEVAGSHVLAALPLFVFMGAMLQRSGIAEGLFEAIHYWTRNLPGGVAVGAIVMCVLFAMSSGVVGATETVVGMLAVSPMLRHGYDKGLISGTICAGGSLGSIIPPSVLVIILASIAELGIGELFAAMLIPGLILAGLYIAHIMLHCLLWPTAAYCADG